MNQKDAVGGIVLDPCRARCAGDDAGEHGQPVSSRRSSGMATKPETRLWRPPEV